MYDVGFTEPEILELFRLIDWLLPLPEALEIPFRHELAHFEQQKSMPFGTSIERLVGRVEGARQALLEVLASRFGNVPPALPQRLEATSAQPLLRLAATVLSI